MTISETIGWFNSIFDLNKRNGQNAKGDFCCVMTDDVEQYKKAHHVEMLGITECSDWDIAKKVMRLMQNEGYHVIPFDSEKEMLPVYVCLYKK